MSYRCCVVCAHDTPQLAFEKDSHPIVRCMSCGMVYVGTDPTQIDFAALYDENYYTGGSDTVFADYVGQQALRRAHARRKLALLRHLPPRLPRSGRLLDVGCAAGFFLAEARAYYEVQGVELSGWSSQFAREQLDLPVRTGTLQDAAFPSEHFDIVTLWDVIEHVSEPLALLREVARVLRTGGRVVLTTGDWGSDYAQARGADWHLMTPPWHLSFFSRNTLAESARRAGLKVVDWRSEGVSGDGPFWRSRAGLLLTRLLDRGDIVRLTLGK